MEGFGGVVGGVGSGDEGKGGSGCSETPAVNVEGGDADDEKLGKDGAEAGKRD